MESKWHIYQELFHEMTQNASNHQNYCKELLLNMETEFEICNMIYKFSVKFITDTFDKLHYIDLDLVEAMILALKNYMLLSNKILEEKNEKNCKRLAEIIMDRIIWHYSGSNYCLADLR